MNEIANQEKKTLWENLLSIDRRIIFIFIAIAISLPLFFKTSLKMPVSPVVQGVYNAVESLPAWLAGRA